jgi:hypothetical protein
MQFTLIFHLFRHSRPIIEYTIMQTLFVQLNMFDNHIKHWSNGFEWEMANCMFEQVLKQN